MADTKISTEGGETGGPAESADETTEFLRKDGVYATPAAAEDVFSLNAGSDTARSAPVLTPAFVAGTAAQLSDTTRDYMVYFDVTTGGTVTTIAIGPTSSANTVTVLSSSTVTTASAYSFRLPAGWYVKWAGTTTVFGQSAVGC